MSPIANISTILFCSGHGTRMKPLTEKTPKPLLPLKDKRPFLSHLLDLLIEKGLSDFFINYSYGKEQFKRLAKEYKGKARIHLVEDNPPVYHGKMLLNIAEKTKKENILGINGDTYIDFDVRAFVQKHLQRKAILSLLSSNKLPNVPRALIVNKENNLIGVEREPPYFYRKKIPRDRHFRPHLGTFLANTAELRTVRYNKDTRLGIFGTQDLAERLTKKMTPPHVIENVPIKHFFTMNTPKDYGNIKNQIERIERTEDNGIETT